MSEAGWVALLLVMWSPVLIALLWSIDVDHPDEIEENDA